MATQNFKILFIKLNLVLRYKKKKTNLTFLKLLLFKSDFIFRKLYLKKHKKTKLYKIIDLIGVKISSK